MDESEFIERLERWIVRNVSASDVPADEGNEDALVYNLVQLARHGEAYDHYDYRPEQDAEIERLRAAHNTSERQP